MHPTFCDQSRPVGIWSELVGILELIKKKFSFVYLKFSDISDRSEKVGIGRKCRVHLWEGDLIKARRVLSFSFTYFHINKKVIAPDSEVQLRLDKGFDIPLISIISPGLARFNGPAHFHVNVISKLSHLGGPARISETARLTGLM